ncbi:MAG: hypothetical protein M1828_006991 [Chrysothrix sp. TS-e1954]|nr:MAG: hypothetical protein M1828_006991 [Chrysothrix sp. TS-e1954]
MAPVVAGPYQALDETSHPINSPSTPEGKRKQKAAELDAFIAHVSERFGLQLDCRPKTPSANRDRRDETACVDGIVQLWWKQRSRLHECIENFASLEAQERTVQRLLTDLRAVDLLVRHSPQKRRNVVDIHDNDQVEPTTKATAPATRTNFAAFQYAAPSFDTSLFATSVDALPNPFSNRRFPDSSSFTTNDESERPKKRVSRTPPTNPQSANTSFNAPTNMSAATTPTASFESIFSRVDPARSADTSFTTDTSAIDSSYRNGPTYLDPTWFSSSPLSSARRTEVSPASVAQTSPHEHDNPILEPRPGEDFHIRNFPKQGLFSKVLPPWTTALPWWVRYELERQVQHHNRSLPYLVFKDYASKDFISPGQLSDLCRDVFPTGAARSTADVSADCWKAATKNSNNVFLTGQIEFRQADKNESIFKLRLSPLKLETGSKRFFRKFGSHRFLSLSFPSFNHVPAVWKAQGEHLAQRVQDWLRLPHKDLMGCRWTAIFARVIKDRRKAKRGKEAEYYGGHEILFFATEGPRLPTINIEEVCDWVLPLSLNRSLTSCKAFARLELGFSKTQATTVFQPSQIRWKTDAFADGQEEDDEFNDSAMNWPAIDHTVKPRVMNDGCALISLAAARSVWASLKCNGPLPSAFQGRIGPAKGMWIVSSPPQMDSNNIWIEISPSQQKFDVHLEDLSDDTFDQERLVLEVLDWSRPPSRSLVYLDYLPILEDRGVSKSSIERFVLDHLDDEIAQIEAVLEDNATFVKWLDDTGKLSMVSDTDTTRWRELRGKLRGDKVRTLLESGFEMSSSDYLAENIAGIVSDHLGRVAKSLNIPIERSRSAYGVADPVSCLAPNEVHFGSSALFVDPKDGSSIPTMFLDGEYALVARHPAIRRSDIQKVRITYKQELRHLVNVVVFPTTGRFPMAGKLQGGDYDGDKFWICWESSLVTSFRNAPAPVDDADPESYGISVDRSTVGQIIEASNDPCKELLMKGFAFQWLPRLLGSVTIYHEKLRYTRNLLSCPSLDAVADIHDLLVDAAKNGYAFSEEQWANFRNTHADLSKKQAQYLQQPAYKLADDVDLLAKSGAVKFDPRNLIDHLIFDVARPKAQGIVYAIRTRLLERVKDVESDVQFLYLQIWNSEDPVLKSCIRRLCEDLEPLLNDWNNIQHKIDGPADRGVVFEQAIRNIRKNFEDLEPRSEFSEHLGIQEWRRRIFKHSSTKWELLKASTLFARYNSKPNFVFRVAGELVCKLKAESVGTTVSIVPNMFSNMKYKKSRSLATRAAVEAAEDEEIDDETQADDEDDTDSFADAETAIQQDSAMRESDNVFYDAAEEVEQMDSMMSQSSIT